MIGRSERGLTYLFTLVVLAANDEQMVADDGGGRHFSFRRL
jgi:hypothetical protein